MSLKPHIEWKWGGWRVRDAIGYGPFAGSVPAAYAAWQRMYR